VIQFLQITKIENISMAEDANI